MKTAILFAGQGAQVVGMGKDLYDQFQTARDLFKQADDVLKTDLTKICFEGPVEELKKTENTQPAVLLMSYICYQLLKEKGVECDTFAGFSLGEYSALTAGGVLNLDESLELVKKRGVIFENTCPKGKGGMAAILGLNDQQVEEICDKVSGIVVPANYNCPAQIVISGEKEAVEKACELAENEYNAMRTVMLNVSGPFHSPLLKDGANELSSVLDSVQFHSLGNYKVLSNVTADYHQDGQIKDLLVKQMFSPVKWNASISKLMSDGYERFIEVGPGRVLTGFMRNIDRSKTALTVNSFDTFQKTLESLK